MNPQEDKWLRPVTVGLLVGVEVARAKLGEGCVDLVSRGGLAGRTSLMVQRLLRSRLRSGRTVVLALTRSGEQGVATLASCTEIVSFACCGSGLGVVSLLSLDWYGFVCYPWGHRNALYSIVGGGRQGQGGEQDTDQAYNNSSFASHSVISLVTSHNPLMHLVNLSCNVYWLAMGGVTVHMLSPVTLGVQASMTILVKSNTR